ncbi:hypothetical protein FJTKL_07662 [Diaporthe vaccinii]|uniref:Uncharacterized protein n=1 Tax=Diaporthe vaccinii TaxID=105482 RepID=A0ABR4ET97_9PEZI
MGSRSHCYLHLHLSASLPFFVHPTHNSSVAYLGLQHSSLPPATHHPSSQQAAPGRSPFQRRPHQAQSGSCPRQQADTTTANPHGPDSTVRSTGPPGRPSTSLRLSTERSS